MKEKNGSEYEEQLGAEIEKRIERMEQPDYQFPARFQRRDYLLWGLAAAICLALVILGAYL